ncbi:hypothetical protein QC762_401870 [Podospora pseudocomata]|uniref:Uncharacterized protein n=1 Tax=Podospora pseudocomata TaxID=2093779 RepID=A0ABR0GEL9_9PEZI|nr:hypothetical protein QC762_401870 [Podospora pseudocomata]
MDLEVPTGHRGRKSCLGQLVFIRLQRSFSLSAHHRFATQQTVFPTLAMYLATTLALLLSSISTVTASRSWVATAQDYGNATFVTGVDDVSEQFKIQWVEGGNPSDAIIGHIPGGGLEARDDKMSTVTVETIFVVDTATSYSSTATTIVSTLVGDSPSPAGATQAPNTVPKWALDVFTQGDTWCPRGVYSTISLLRYGTFCLKTPAGTTSARIPQGMMGGCSTTLFQDENCSVGPVHIENEEMCMRLRGSSGVVELKSFVVAC